MAIEGKVVPVLLSKQTLQHEGVLGSGFIDIYFLDLGTN
jgi:hypothetical protein